ncbi:hypothetical protein [Shewanella algae]|uniref:hypothetical protein n=1 Tax=Shewanella algae TaxID=38313 RepID=UPI0031F5B90F
MKQLFLILLLVAIPLQAENMATHFPDLRGSDAYVRITEQSPGLIKVFSETSKVYAYAQDSSVLILYSNEKIFQIFGESSLNRFNGSITDSDPQWRDFIKLYRETSHIEVISYRSGGVVASPVNIIVL